MSAPFLRSIFVVSCRAMKRTSVVLIVGMLGIATIVGCASAAPTKTAVTAATASPTTASSAPVAPPLDCQTLCTRANNVAGCATDAANVPACDDVCTRMLGDEGGCKTKVEAELACAPKITLTCTSSGAVEWGSCAADQRAANECARAMPPKP